MEKYCALILGKNKGSTLRAQRKICRRNSVKELLLTPKLSALTPLCFCAVAFGDRMEIFMILALDEAKRRLLDMQDILAELGNQLRIEEAKERATELERETMVENFWNDAEKSSKKLQEI